MKPGNQLADFLSRIAILVIVMIGIVGVFGWYLPLIKENQALRKEIGVKKAKIVQLSLENQEKLKKYESYQHDAKSVERLARESLLYSKDGETIFRFESPKKKPAHPSRANGLDNSSKAR